MDPNVQKALNDKLYDRRKGGALELEALVRDSLAANDFDRIGKIVHQLCHEYAYAVHQPHARNGGLIGLAAASIALGSEVAQYLEEIVPPVLACFSDQDARVRYYACESMYNIAKVAKGEILVYFNEVFDALCKLAADSELSVKNGAELLDRLVKDIVSESAASYVSILQNPEDAVADSESALESKSLASDMPTAFSLSRFIPLLQERIAVMNPFTRVFLVSWITLLDSIPDLELVSYLPSFLYGLMRFLGDTNQDVHTATQVALDRFLAEIKKIARIKKGLAESRKSAGEDGMKRSTSSTRSDRSVRSRASVRSGHESAPGDDDGGNDGMSASAESESGTANDEKSAAADGDWIPGQDVQVDHPKIIGIMATFLSESSDEEIQMTALRWIDSFFDICPEDILPFVPRLLSQVLPAMSSDVDQVRAAANRVNTSLMSYIMSLASEGPKGDEHAGNSGNLQPPALPPKDLDRRESLPANKSTGRVIVPAGPRIPVEQYSSTLPEENPLASHPATDLDYEAAVNSLTLQFLNEHEATRVAALQWLIMLHRKAPRKILAINDGTFPALLKTLSDPAEAVVTRDLQLLSQISKNSDDSYFSSFMVNLLKLFATDRRLLETRGNLIIRQLCMSLSPERIYRTLADCLEKDEDVEFASIMVQNLNNNLVTAPELADLRRRLRNLETKDGQTFFVSLFRSWCHNGVATFSLCLLAQAYEQAYNLLQILGELEMTVNVLIQIDKLVQLIESPVFTYLRLQLLEPEKFPYLYKCLYGLLMLLPQSSAFAALKNRLNSVSAIGYLHIAPRTGNQAGAPSYDRPNRLKAREDGGIKWSELLEKFKAVQEKARRQLQMANHEQDGSPSPMGVVGLALQERPNAPDAPPKPTHLRPGSAAANARPPPVVTPQPAAVPPRTKSNFGNLGRLAGGVAGRRQKK